MADVERTGRQQPLTATRFKLKSLFFLTVGVAILSAVAGTFFRSKPESEQNDLLVFWLAGSFAFALLMLAYLWQRHRSETSVGWVRFRLPWFMCIRSMLVSPKPYGYFTLAVAAFIGMQITFDIARISQVGKPTWSIVTGGVGPGMFAAIGLCAIWWQKECWIGEHGIAWLSFFRPWEKIKASSHKKKDYVLVFVVQHGLVENKIAVRVPVEVQPHLVAFLHEKLGADSSIDV